MLSRRQLLAGSAGLAIARNTGLHAEQAPTSPGVPAGTTQEAVLEALPGKRPLIKLTYRPPNYETPLDVFRQTITPNDAFFVRYHLSEIPQVDAATWSLKIGGANPLAVTLDQLKSDYAPVEVVAVCQCSGNRRGLSSPHVPGVEWGLGAMGNARWKGVRFRDLLTKTGLPQDTLEIVVNGADHAINPKTPDFVKSLPLWKAMDENTIIAYEMNGQPLPHWNGFPARLIVPGWTATYWMKHLTEVTPSSKPFDGFWMKSAYRIPLGLFPAIDRFVSQETTANTPITEMMVNSIITSPTQGAKLKAGRRIDVAGIAWDGGRGIERVAVSIDGGQSWTNAAFGEDLGRFSFRPWSFQTPVLKAGRLSIMARATNKAGQTQVTSAIFNPPGYHHNVVHRVDIDVA